VVDFLLKQVNKRFPFLLFAVVSALSKWLRSPNTGCRSNSNTPETMGRFSEPKNSKKAVARRVLVALAEDYFSLARLMSGLMGYGGEDWPTSVEL